MAANYYGMTPVQFGNNVQGLLLLPKDYDKAKKYPCIFHYCGNGEVGTNLSLLLNTGFGRQVALGKVAGTIAEQVINVIVQSKQSGTASQPNDSNPPIDYMLANYSVDQSKDENGKYNSLLFAGLSQGASDVWTIASYDPAVTAYGTSKYAGKIKHVWPASIPALFPSHGAYNRMTKTNVHFTHGTNDMQGCCAYWPVPDMVKALQNIGATASLFTVQGGGHDNGTWDIHWNPLAPDDRNMYVVALAYLNSGIATTAKFSYAKADGSMWYEDNGTVSNNVYKLSSGEIVVPIQVF